jgi:hypothetical protein
MENQTVSVQKRKFLCLEDRFLQALYNEKKSLSLQSLADHIFISVNAAHSILHRIQKETPQYIIVDALGGQTDLWLAPKAEETNNVEAFLTEGGFTKINEDEFLRYYEKELKKQKWQSRLQNVKSNLHQKKWQLSAIALTGGGLLLATYLHFKKN